MGTTLTGTTPQDTYDSLIKVTDNGPLSGTAKYLSDGLGNDSVVALSTSRVGINTATPAQRLNVKGSSGDGIALTHSNNTIIAELIELSGVQGAGMLLKNSTGTTNILLNAGGDCYINGGNVGIGTSAPNVSGYSRALTISSSNSAIELTSATNVVQSTIASSAQGLAVEGIGTAGIRFFTSTSGATTERVRVTNDGLTFNGDTAAANALDDYEEGTWTMGISFGGASVGVTYAANTGTYTKIGRQVTVNGYLNLSSKGSSTGVAKITGLPFTIPNLSQNYSAASLFFINISYTNQFQSFGEISTTGFVLEQITLLGASTALNNTNFANNSGIILSFTYSV